MRKGAYKISLALKIKALTLFITSGSCLEEEQPHLERTHTMRQTHQTVCYLKT